MADQLANLRAAYHVLAERVHIALRTQVGDRTRLQHQIDEATTFLAAADQVSPLTTVLFGCQTYYGCFSRALMFFQLLNMLHFSAASRT